MNYYSIILGAVSLGLLWAVMTMGVFITYRILDYADLTVEGSLVTGAAIAAKLITDGTDPFVALAAAFVGGCAAGCVTGLLNTAMKIPGLLAGILSMIALYSVNIRIMGKANITLLKSRTVYDVLENIGISNDIAVLIFAVALNAALVGILYWFFTTQLGYAIRAAGDNRKMARAQGINTDIMKILALAVSNGLVALSGGLIAQYQKYSDVSMGQGAIVIGLASVIIGEVLFYRKGFLGKLVAVVSGAVVYRLIIAAVIELGMQPMDLKLFTAITVALALYTPNIKLKLPKPVFKTLKRKEGVLNEPRAEYSKH